MFLGCSLVVSSFLIPLFVPYCPQVAAPPTRQDSPSAALSPAFSPRADPIQPPGLTPAHHRYSPYRDGSGLVKVTMAATSRPNPNSEGRNPKEGSISKIEATLGYFGFRVLGLRLCAHGLVVLWKIRPLARSAS